MSASLNVKLTYEPAFDGLRALAVLSVMLFHALPAVLPGGFLGVDIFFVLSGYLITKLLIREYEDTGSIDFLAFYIRRWWRIGPAFILMLMVYGIVVFVDGATVNEKGLDIALAIGYLTNWSRAFGWRNPVDLGHTWSLAIEEQFYVLWPLLLWSLMHYLKRGKNWLIAISCLAFLSWAWRQYLNLDGATVDRLYNGLDTRSEALFFGAVLAALIQIRGAQPSTIYLYRVTAYALSVAFISVGSLMFLVQWTDPVIYSIGLTWVATMGCIIIWGVSQVKYGFLVQLLRSRFLVAIGKISYGMYLWHVPVLRVLITQGLQGWLLMVVNLIVTVIVAYFSFRWIERPLLKRYRA